MFRCAHRRSLMRRLACVYLWSLVSYVTKGECFDLQSLPCLNNSWLFRDEKCSSSSSLSPSSTPLQVVEANVIAVDCFFSSVSDCTLNEVNTNTSCGKVCSETSSGDVSEKQQDDISYQLPSRDAKVWIYSIGSAFFISLAGVWGYFLLPLLTASYADHVMNVLIGLSFGSLVTSSLCQLIPEAYKLDLTSSGYSYTYVAVCSMLGVWITILIQSFATIFGSDDVPSTSNNEQMHLATITEAEVDNDGVLSAGDNIRNKCHNGGTPMVTAACGASSSASDAAAVDVNIRLADCNTIGVAGNVSLNNEHRKSDTELKPLSNSSRMARRCSSYQSVKNRAKLSKLAIIILAGDCMNNFMDGISIGAGFSYHLSTGVKLSAAIAFEEYTHKLGDFAIVFQSGISMKRVLFWNYSTSCACFVGVVIGIGLGNMHCSQYIFSFASGLFLYISLSNMIPEMQNMLNDSLTTSKKKALISLFEQHVGFALAFILLLAISLMVNAGTKHTQ